MKLDAFEQYIHDQYQGFEVAPPPAMESAVMGRLRRRAWAQRVSGATLTLMVGAGAVWAWSARSVESTYVPSPAAMEWSHEVVEGSVVEFVVAEESGAAATRESVPTHQVVSTAPAMAPESVDPLPHRNALTTFPTANAGDRTLQSASSKDEWWVISAEVEVEH